MRQFGKQFEQEDDAGVVPVVDEKPKEPRPTVTPADPPQLSGKRDRGMFAR